MSAQTDVVSDFDAAFDRLRAARNSDEQRRALREVLACLYELRAYREGAPRSADQKIYRDKARKSSQGRVTEGIVALRGAMTHDLVKQVRPEVRPLYPGQNLYPSQNLFPGENLTWLLPGEMPNPFAALSLGDPRPSYYANDVAGRPVLPTLEEARYFLVDPAVLGAL